MADGDMKLEVILQQTAEIAVPVIVLGEYKYGIRQSRSRARYEGRLTDVVANCRVNAAAVRYLGTNSGLQHCHASTRYRC